MNSKENIAKKNKFDGSLMCGTENFNRKTGRNEHVDKSVELQRGYFIDPKTGTLYEQMAEYRNCPICGSGNFNKLFAKDGFEHVKCACGFVLVNPVARDGSREHFFKEVYETWTEVLFSPEQELIDTHKFKYGLELIESYRKRKGFLVDIGAGTGLFLKIARDAGWKVSGVEFNRKAVNNIKKQGIEVFDRPLSQGIYDADSADVVTIWEVLEHINNPNEFMKEIVNVLKPQGLLFICVPNIDALATRILHEKARTFGGSSHVNFFNIDTLSALVKKNGLEIIKADTAISEIGTVKNYLSYEDPYAGRAEPGLGFLTPEFLYSHNLGSRIFMLCRKGKQ